MSKKKTSKSAVEESNKTDTIIPAVKIDDINGELLGIGKFRTFANCGMERTIFKVNSSENALTADITFKKTRLRDCIPEYAGIYWLFPKALNVKNGVLQFKLRSPNKSIQSVDVEIKPEGRAWMHEVFQYDIPTDSTEVEYSINIPSHFTDKRTAECLNEITFVIHPTDFVNDMKLSGQLVISDLKFLPESEISEGSFVSASATVAERLDSIDSKVKDLDAKMDDVYSETKAINEYIRETLIGNIKQLKTELKEEIEKVCELKENSSDEKLIADATNILDRKISEAFNKCSKQVNKDLRYAGQNISSTIIEMNEKRLKELFSCNSLYQKMQEYTRASLLSAACLWESCKNIDENSVFDYSGVCISATSALENELKRIFFDGFYAYLNKFSHNTYSGVAHRKKFTMHTATDILSQSRPTSDGIMYIRKNVYSNLSNEQSLIDEMRDYLSYLCGKSFTQNSDYVKLFDEEQRRINHIRDNYRNKAAHTDNIDMSMATDCYNEIIGKSEAERLANDIPNVILALYNKIDIDKLKQLETT